MLGQTLGADMVDGFVKGVYELAEVLLVEIQLMLLVGVLAGPLALGDGEEKVLARPRGLDVEEVGAFACRDTPGKDLVVIVIAHALAISASESRHREGRGARRDLYIGPAVMNDGICTARG